MHSSPLNQPPTWSRAPTRSRQASESRRASLASLLSCIKFRATNTRGSFPGVARLFEFPDLPFKVLDLARLVGQLPLILSGLLVQSRHRYSMRSHLCHSPKKPPAVVERTHGGGHPGKRRSSSRRPPLPQNRRTTQTGSAEPRPSSLASRSAGSSVASSAPLVQQAEPLALRRWRGAACNL